MSLHLDSPTLTPPARGALEFLWLELTHQCNLRCVHCYADSSPETVERDLLHLEDYLRAMAEARELGCRQVQFIGGEPTLNRGLPAMIKEARRLGYELVEVYTNLVALPEKLLEALVRHRVAVATSFYSADPAEHDRITTVPGSHRRTVANIQRVLRAGLSLRVGLVPVGDPPPDTVAAEAFLRDLGVTHVKRDRVRGVGRASEECAMGELCGGCADNVLAIGPDGIVAPCVMSRPWQVGSILERPLGEILRSDALRDTRAAIALATRQADVTMHSSCGPNDPNCYPNCSPMTNCNPCAPNGGNKCQPNDWCNPAK
jgi:MoaA/NifB/PqqE/SkfB family radical SAM enzyme